MIFINDRYKIFVPPSMIGPLFAYTHLLGHIGVPKMIKNLENYHFHMYSTIKRLISCCYACFLSRGSSRQHKLGWYPFTNYPMEEVSVDLAESLNRVGGYENLLIVQDVLTYFIIISPLKGKTAKRYLTTFFTMYFKISTL